MYLCIVPHIDRKRPFKKERIDLARHFVALSKRLQTLNKGRTRGLILWISALFRLYNNCRTTRSLPIGMDR